MGMHKSNETSLAAYILYVSSILGLVGIYTPAAINGAYTHLVSIDVLAYIVLFVIAFGIHRGITGSKLLYAVLAVVWYASLLFYLPERYGHSIDLYMIFMQIIMVVAAYIVMLAQQKVTTSVSS